MNRFKKNQTGFSAVEGLLVIVIIGVIGFVGWYVWHAKQSSDKTLNTVTAANASSSTNSGSSGATTASTSSSPGSKDNTALQTDLSGITGADAQSNQDLSTSNSSLNDQSTFTSIPQ